MVAVGGAGPTAHAQGEEVLGRYTFVISPLAAPDEEMQFQLSGTLLANGTLTGQGFVMVSEASGFAKYYFDSGTWSDGASGLPTSLQRGDSVCIDQIKARNPNEEPMYQYLGRACVTAGQPLTLPGGDVILIVPQR